MTLPNFFIIGAPKCGTTSLSHWLNEHPNVFISRIKEPFFFSSDLHNQIIKDIDDYHKLFDQIDETHIAIGEASTTYLFSKTAVPSIEQVIPNSKYIIMIRNPVDMAYSLHEQQIYSGNEHIRDFNEAWNLSPSRRKGENVSRHCKSNLLLDYQDFCKVGEQVLRLLNFVPKKRLLILVLDDIKENPQKEYSKVLSFLNVPNIKLNDFNAYNTAKEWRNPWIGRMIKRSARKIIVFKNSTKILQNKSFGIINYLHIIATKNRSRPPLSTEIRRKLGQFFLEDIHLLENILDRDLSLWISKNSE